MPFDPITWALGYAASQGASALIEKIFDVGAHSEIRAAAAAWASELPEEIRTSSEALFNFDMLETGGAGPSRSKLKKTILELHNIPSENQWFGALIESWESTRNYLGPDANAFFQLDKPTAEKHLRELARAIFAACASILKYSQPLLVREVREIGITQSLLLQEVKAFRSHLNNLSAKPNAAITLNLDPTHIDESHLHGLNEVLCVDSPAEVISGRYRTHELWVGPTGCSKEAASYVPLQPQYVENKVKPLIEQWNRVAIDLAKLDAYSVISALASFHHKFLEIHPYPDANGRVARVILDLQVRNYTPARSPLRLKSHGDYFLALRAADSGNIDHLIDLITSILKVQVGNWEQQRPTRLTARSR